MSPSRLTITAPIRCLASTSVAVFTGSVGFTVMICLIGLASMMLRTIMRPPIGVIGKVLSRTPGVSSRPSAYMNGERAQEKAMRYPIEGGCLCGAVRYRIDGEPLGAGICHCATCRRAAGAQSVGWGTFPAENFAFVAGRPAEYASSPGVVRTHCAACGTSLTFQREPESIDVTLASLDDPEAMPPTSEVWLSHRLSWEPVGPRRAGFSGAGRRLVRPESPRSHSEQPSNMLFLHEYSKNGST